MVWDKWEAEGLIGKLFLEYVKRRSSESTDQVLTSTSLILRADTIGLWQGGDVPSWPWFWPSSSNGFVAGFWVQFSEVNPIHFWQSIINGIRKIQEIRQRIRGRAARWLAWVISFNLHSTDVYWAGPMGEPFARSWKTVTKPTHLVPWGCTVEATGLSLHTVHQRSRGGLCAGCCPVTPNQGLGLALGKEGTTRSGGRVADNLQLFVTWRKAKETKEKNDCVYLCGVQD